MTPGNAPGLAGRTHVGLREQGRADHSSPPAPRVADADAVNPCITKPQSQVFLRVQVGRSQEEGPCIGPALLPSCAASTTLLRSGGSGICSGGSGTYSGGSGRWSGGSGICSGASGTYSGGSGRWSGASEYVPVLPEHIPVVPEDGPVLRNMFRWFRNIFRWFRNIFRCFRNIFRWFRNICDRCPRSAPQLASDGRVEPLF